MALATLVAAAIFVRDTFFHPPIRSLDFREDRLRFVHLALELIDHPFRRFQDIYSPSAPSPPRCNCAP
jgi:hypothetical protein